FRAAWRSPRKRYAAVALGSSRMASRQSRRASSSFPPLGVGEPPAQVCVDVLRVEPDGLAEVRDGLVVVPLLEVGPSPRAVRPALSGAEADGGAEVRDGFVVVPLALVVAQRYEFLVSGVVRRRLPPGPPWRLP